MICLYVSQCDERILKRREDAEEDSKGEKEQIIVLSRYRQSVRANRKATWFEQIMAAIALTNLILVLFDLSYIPYRDLYLRTLPNFTEWYGEKFKGIEPDRTTVAYLKLVDRLESQEIDDSKALLAQLREQSTVIVDENPFAVASKSGTLERIKNLMRDRFQEDSSKAAFNQFWSEDYLQTNTAEKLAFFDREIRPLMNVNYFRGINERGNPIDSFWRIDLWFMALFATEFLIRTYVLSRRHENASWPDAMLWRIYDVPLFIGFWRWLRIIPVTLRLHQAGWVNLEPMRNRVSRAIVSQFAVELTEIVLLRAIDQTQRLIQEGDVTRWLLAASDRNQYVDLNGIDEVQTLTKRLSDVMVYKVLPRVKPDLDALIEHSVIGALQQAPAYQGLKFMPGFDNISAQISHQVVAELSKTMTQSLQAAVADPKTATLTGRLLDRLGETLRYELQNAETTTDIRQLISDLLEEVKINYVERIAGEDVEQIRASRYRIYDAANRRR